MKLKALISLLDANVQLDNYLDYLNELGKDWISIKQETIDNLDILAKEEDRESIKNIFKMKISSDENVTAIFCSRYKGRDFILYNGFYFPTIKKFLEYCVFHPESKEIFEILKSQYFKEYSRCSKIKSVPDSLISNLHDLFEKSDNISPEEINTFIKTGLEKSLQDTTKLNEQTLKCQLISDQKDIKETEDVIQKFKSEKLESLFLEFDCTENRKKLFTRKFLTHFSEHSEHKALYAYLISEVVDKKIEKIKDSDYALLSFDLYNREYCSAIEETHFIFQGKIYKSITDAIIIHCSLGMITTDLAYFIILIGCFYYGKVENQWKIIYSIFLKNKEEYRKFIYQENNNYIVLDKDNFLDYLKNNMYQLKGIVTQFMNNDQFRYWVKSFLNLQKPVSYSDDLKVIQEFINDETKALSDLTVFFILLEGVYGLEVHKTLIELLFATSEYSFEYWIIQHLDEYDCSALSSEKEIVQLKNVQQSLKETSISTALSRVKPFEAEFAWFLARIAPNFYHCQIENQIAAILPLKTEGFCLQCDPRVPIGFYRYYVSNLLPNEHVRSENILFQKSKENTEKWIETAEQNIKRIEKKKFQFLYVKIIEIIITTVVMISLWKYNTSYELNAILLLLLGIRSGIILLNIFIQLQKLPSFVLTSREMLLDFSEKYPEQYLMIHNAVAGSLAVSLKTQDYYIGTKVHQNCMNMEFLLSAPFGILDQSNCSLENEINLNISFRILNILLYSLAIFEICDFI